MVRPELGRPVRWAVPGCEEPLTLISLGSIARMFGRAWNWFTGKE